MREVNGSKRSRTLIKALGLFKETGMFLNERTFYTGCSVSSVKMQELGLKEKSAAFPVLFLSSYLLLSRVERNNIHGKKYNFLLIFQSFIKKQTIKL